jgi:hypothetical protein
MDGFPSISIKNGSGTRLVSAKCIVQDMASERQIVFCSQESPVGLFLLDISNLLYLKSDTSMSTLDFLIHAYAT